MATPLISYSPGQSTILGSPPTMAELLWPGWSWLMVRISAVNLLGVSVVIPRPLPYGSTTTLASRPRSRKQAWPTKLISINTSLYCARSHPGWRGDAHQAQQVAHRLTRRLAKIQPCPSELGVLADDPQPDVLGARVIEGVDPLRQPLGVVRQMVRLEVAGRLVDH